jgi:hypothetical protein
MGHMEKAQYLRAQAAHCLELLERAKRADVQKALRSLAQEYDAAVAPAVAVLAQEPHGA